MQITFWKSQDKVFFRLKHSMRKTRRFKSRPLIPYLLGSPVLKMNISPIEIMIYNQGTPV